VKRWARLPGSNGLDFLTGHVALLQWLRGHLKQFVALGRPKRPIAQIVMSEPLALSLGQKFELERMSRAIDATVDPQALKGLAKQLLQAWHSQKAATQWVMRQQLGNPSKFASELAMNPGAMDDLNSSQGPLGPDAP
jgi:hypothetical protein